MSILNELRTLVVWNVLTIWWVTCQRILRGTGLDFLGIPLDRTDKETGIKDRYWMFDVLIECVKNDHASALSFLEPG